MANIKISALTPVTTVVPGTDVAPLVSGGITTKATPQQIVNAGLLAPGAIGSGTASTGSFTTLSASSTVSGTGFSTYLASPPAIGSTAPSTGKFTAIESTIATGTAPFKVVSTTNVANLNASSLGGATFAAPGAIGSGTASTGAFTTLSATSTVSGTGFSTYLLSPPAIGTTAPAAGKFTDLTSTGNTTIGDASTDTFTVYPQTISLINSTAITAASTKSLTLNGGAGSNGLVLDSNNSLGYAAAPSPWFTTNGNRAIDVGTYVSFAQIGSTGGAAVVSNAYLTSASQWTAKNTNGATLYQTYPTAHDWSYAPSVTGGTALTFVKAMTLDSTGSLLIVGPGGLGYGTGSGGAVTQATSRTTGVTLNKTNGAITLVSAAGLATYQTFTVTNSTVAATDVIHVSQKSGTDKYIILVTAVAAGSFAITYATTGGVTTEQPVFNFAIIKAVTA